MKKVSIIYLKTFKIVKKILVIGANSDIAKEFIKISISKNLYLYLALRDNKYSSKFISELSLDQKSNYKVLEIDLEKNILFENYINDLDKSIDMIIFFSGYYEKPEVNHQKISVVNFLGPKNFILKLIKKKEFVNLNKIICLTSIAGDREPNYNQSYSRSKRDISNFLKKLNKSEKKISFIDIKPGYVKTKMTHNLKLNKLLISKPQYVAKNIYLSLDTTKNEIYIPFYWKIIMLVYKLIFFKKSE